MSYQLELQPETVETSDSVPLHIILGALLVSIPMCIVAVTATLVSIYSKPNSSNDPFIIFCCY